MYRKYREARWYSALANKKVRCYLCPRECVISDMQSGFCSVRKNVEGKLYSAAYGFPVALQIDPIEKKPFAEFMPGTKTFSIGTYGCNLNCFFCQNYHLSRGHYNEKQAGQYVSPESAAQLALKNECRSIAFTYNEPTIFAEYCIDTAREARKVGLASVLVTNGYITERAAQDLYPEIDAANIDMKGFSEEFYLSMTGTHLQPVLDAIKYLYKLGKHLEITNLLIPGKNDSDELIETFLDWTAKNLSAEVPIHFSAFHPDYKLHDVPHTPTETLHKIKEKAQSIGFSHIYLGNI
ncbi:MAG: AmmeMemoRadiSam system radical SAM enzyme [Lentisphaerae bacterium GWF2_45_14]|nr:MAG: AmmeMemoRadiSam system radical SAM enzyme [Lentisphaerae bacterium GWF2_45_14]